jgi:hypothetical protein
MKEKADLRQRQIDYGYEEKETSIRANLKYRSQKKFYTVLCIVWKLAR